MHIPRHDNEPDGHRPCRPPLGESKNPEPGRFDLLSVPLSMAAVLPVIYGLKEIPSEGWNVRYVVSITVGLLFAALFVHRRRTAASPMISPALFRGRGFAPSVGLNLVSAFGITGSAYFTTQYLQSVLDKSALEAALWALCRPCRSGRRHRSRRS